MDIPSLEALLRKYEEALNKEIEDEMRRVMQVSPQIGALLKCMGTVVAYKRSDGHSFFDNELPVSCRRLMQLADMDATNFSLTGHPLKIVRNNDGTFTEVRDW